MSRRGFIPFVQGYNPEVTSFLLASVGQSIVMSSPSCKEAGRNMVFNLDGHMDSQKSGVIKSKDRMNIRRKLSLP